LISFSQPEALPGYQLPAKSAFLVFIVIPLLSKMRSSDLIQRHSQEKLNQVMIKITIPKF
jgi:hypothetical protein